MSFEDIEYKTYSKYGGKFMSVRGKITKLFAALVTLAVVAAMCVLLVACDPDKGGENTGGGDVIFTKVVTLAELTEKINAAESFVWSQSSKRYDTNGVYTGDGHSAGYKLDGKTVYFWFEDNTTPYGADYFYSSNGYYYEASVYEDAPIQIEKSLSMYGELDEYASDVLETFKKYYVLDCLKEVDGKIVFNEKAALVDSDDYVEGSGYVRFKGNTMEYGWQLSVNEDGETTTYNYSMTVSLVNAYSFEITPELKEAEKTATWAEYVSYNGVDYRKAVDETTGEEYYYVAYAPDGAVAESTINTLPVKPRR